MAGGLTTGVVALNKRRQKPLSEILVKAASSADRIPPGLSISSLAAKTQTRWDSFKEGKLAIFFADTRSRQWQEMRNEEGALVESRAPLTLAGKEEARVDRYLLTSGAAMGLALAGIAVPVLSLVSGIVTFYSCIPLFQDGYTALIKEHRLRWTTLDSIAILSVLAARYVFAAAFASTIYFAGVKMMLKTEDRSRRSLANIFGQQPRTAWLLVDGMEVEVPFDQVKVGDILVVHTGQMIPVDGIVTGGNASVDQHVLTGESQPAEKGPGEPVYAATVVLAGRLLVRVEKAGDETVAAQVREILANTAAARTQAQARWQDLADRSVFPTLGVAAVAFGLVNPIAGVAVLGSNFAPALQVASPLAMLNYLRRASQAGILIKDGRSLEKLGKVDTLIFDKTGTLTLPQPEVKEIYTVPGVSADELLTYAAAVEAKQSHPLAHAILQEADARNLPRLALDEARYEVGYGIQARIDGQVVRVGSARYMAAEGITLPAESQVYQAASQTQGTALVYVAFGAELAGAIEMRSTLRPEVKSIVAELQERDITIYIISGDHEPATQTLAAELGIDHYFANVLPQDKAALVEQLQQEGRTVCFVGDGINDAIALQKADISISLRGASALATNTAQIILMNSNLEQLSQLFALGTAFDANVNATLFTTFAPGLLSLGGIFFLGTGVHLAVFLYNCSMIAGFLTGMSPALKTPPPAPVQPTELVTTG